MRDDEVEVPAEIPRKRRQLQQALDRWLAVWLARDDLTPSERRRVEEERAERRRRAPTVVIGFTGTRAGMTPQQLREVAGVVRRSDVTAAHHGDCLGADAQFHDLCIGAGVPVVIHPSSDPSLRAWCQGAVRVERPRPPLERNKDIVREATILVATPKEMREQARGGTWSTVYFARQRRLPTDTIMPNGERLNGERR